jgi:hypothetical protein
MVLITFIKRKYIYRIIGDSGTVGQLKLKVQGEY